jgi:hypothetical protein
MKRLCDRLGRCIVNPKLGQRSSCAQFSPSETDRGICRYVWVWEHRDERGSVVRCSQRIGCKLRRPLT